MRDRFGLSEEQTDRAAWVIGADGSVVGGARAIALAIAVVWRSPLPLTPWKIPGADRVLDLAYRAVAASRHRLPSTTPYCVEHPDDCVDR